MKGGVQKTQTRPFASTGFRYRPTENLVYRDHHSNYRATALSADKLSQIGQQRASVSESNQLQSWRPSEEEGIFVWREHWYPVALVSNLDKLRPQKITLLNDDFVLWWGEDNKWHAARDQCPHKMAPLSEGRMDNGVLECRYHGWQFQSNGSCRFSPQSASVPNTCLQSYPAQEAQGLLWVWPVSGALAEKKASAKPLPLYKEGEQHGLEAHDRDFFEVLVPATWFLAVENFQDPSHAASLHEGAVGCGTRETMAHIKMEIEGVDASGIRLKHDGFTKGQQAMQMTATREMVPPSVQRFTYAFPGGANIQTLIYLVPETPSTTRSFGKIVQSGIQAFSPNGSGDKANFAKLVKKVIQSAKSLAYEWLGFSPTVEFHTASQGFTNQDTLLMRRCEAHMERNKILNRNRKSRNPSRLSAQNYKLQPGPDEGAMAFWRWVDEWGGEPDWGTGSTAQDPFSENDRKSLFNHYARHTVNCSHCLRAERRIELAQKWLQYSSVILCALAVVFIESRILRFAMVSLSGILHIANLHVRALQAKLHGTTLLPDEH